MNQLTPIAPPCRDDPNPCPRLLLFPASLRQNSHQRRLVDHFATVLASRAEIVLLTGADVPLPLYNQDLETSEALRVPLAALRARIVAADGMIVASPEYNGHVPPYLKNTVDWVSRLPRIDPTGRTTNVFFGKPLLLASASTGWSGGLLGLQDARTIFAYLGCLVSAEQICVSNADHWAAGGAFRFEPAFADYIAQVLSRFLALVSVLAVRSSLPVQ